MNRDAQDELSQRGSGKRSSPVALYTEAPRFTARSLALPKRKRGQSPFYKYERYSAPLLVT